VALILRATVTSRVEREENSDQEDIEMSAMTAKHTSPAASTLGQAEHCKELEEEEDTPVDRAKSFPIPNR
jgi:hypothetical protein